MVDLDFVLEDVTDRLSRVEDELKTGAAGLALARQQLDILRKAQLIQNSSGVAPLEDRRAVASRVMEILYEVELLEEVDEG